MYELPQNLDTLSVDELQALIDQGLDALRALGITEESDEATIAEGERIAPLITQVSDRKRVVEAEAASRRARASTLLETLATPTEPEPAPEPDPAAPPETTPEPTAETPPPEPAPEVLVPDLVSASGTRTSPARRAAANAAPVNLPVAVRAEPVSLLAAADVPGFPTGAPLEGLDAVGQAVIARMRGLPTTHVGGPDGVRMSYGAAVIRKNGYGNLTQAADHDDYHLVTAAGNEARLPGGSLTAAGGWCAPSETLYDLCQYETVDGILSMPEFQVTRGGIRWTQGPDFADIYEACGFFLTEAEAVAGTAQKTCCMVECPPFEEIRLDAIGLCVKAPLLTQAAYPELVRRFMEGALVAHQHIVNRHLIDQIEIAAGSPVNAPDTGSLFLSLTYLELLAMRIRYRYRMSQTQTIEVVAPFWLKALIRADLGMRAFPQDESDARINAWFSNRNMSVQWVYDFQDLTGPTDCAVDIPAAVTVLMYPAGTWTRGSLDVINIDAVYDSTGLAENVYTALFMEEGILAVQRCTHTCAVSIPICVSGRTGAADIAECVSFDLTGGGGQAFSNRANAGAPGTWAPASSRPPLSVADLQAGEPLEVTASPATVWTTGQYVQTGTAGAGGQAHWDGDSWVAGPKA